MRKRTVLLMLVLSWLLLLLCNQSIMVTWSQNSRDSIMALGVSISLLYVGLATAISPETSLPYRSRLPWQWWTTPTTVRVMGLVLAIGSLVLGWAALGHLFGLIKP
jgi:hypothetical protein